MVSSVEVNCSCHYWSLPFSFIRSGYSRFILLSQSDRLSVIQSNRQTVSHSFKQTERHSVRQTVKSVSQSFIHSNRQTDRQTVQSVSCVITAATFVNNHLDQSQNPTLPLESVEVKKYKTHHLSV